MPETKLIFVNSITLWRIVSAPVIVILAILGKEEFFRWLLLLSFLTDAVDGTLARHYHVAGKRGAVLDSIGDDLTVLAGFIGLSIFQFQFVIDELFSLALTGTLWLAEIAIAIRKYGRMTAFHTILAKIAAVLQAIFLLTSFFWQKPAHLFFHLAVVITCVQLVEDILLVIILPTWKSNVKGLYWHLRP
ncbi:MAG TPA: CDP-alcohol phosphatidyltransferase family protein [Puia sp.]|nr:CDP-alcohol phosphatidyltransferase family protein [Puia sp.]